MSTSIVTSKHNALLNVAGQTARSIPDLEHAWLSNELGITSGNSISLPELWKMYLVAFGIEEASIVTMMDEWLTEGGYTGAGALQEMWEDKAALLFSVLSPQASGEISVEPINGTGSATFARTGEVAHVRDHENVYRLVQASEARIQGARRVENLCRYSQDIDNVLWGKTAGGTGVAPTVTANYGAAPDGSLTADRVQLDRGVGTTTGDISYINMPITNIVGAFSGGFWLKTNDGTTSDVTVRVGTGLFAYDIIVTGTWKRFSTSGDTTLDRLQLLLYGNQNDQTADLLVWGAQVENVSGASNTTPSEYIPTTSAVVSKYFWRTNGNSVSSNVVTEAQGITLHPVVLKAGQNVFARYATREDSTAYVVGDNMIPATGSGPAGGNGYWYQVTTITTGTSGAGAPTFPETIGDTVVDGGITIENMGHYKLAGYLGEPAATNSILQSRQFDTTWINSGTVQTQDQDGIDGVANVAWQLEDNSGAAIESVDQAVAIANDSNTHTFSIYILKDSDISRFPAVTWQLTGGTVLTQATHLNTQTGAIVDEVAGGTSTVEDHGLWWKLVLTLTNNTTGNVTSTVYVAPAKSTVIGTPNAAAIGTTIFDQAQLELNTSVPSSPIITTTVAVTRTDDELDYSDAIPNNDVSGFVDIHYVNAWSGVHVYLDARSDGSNGLDIFINGTTITARKQIAGTPYSATISQTLEDNTTYRLGFRLSSADGVDIWLDGVKGSNNSNTDNATNGSNFYINNGITGASQPAASEAGVRVYDTALSDAEMSSITSAD